MGTNTSPKPDQLGRARPSHSAEGIDVLPQDDLWEWSGALLEVDEYAFADHVDDIPTGAPLAPSRDGESVLVALQNRFVGRLPTVPTVAVSDAVDQGRLVSIVVTSTNADTNTVEVRVRVQL